MNKYKILRIIIIITAFMLIPLLLVMPILLIFERNISIFIVVFWFLVFIFISSALHRDIYTTDHLKNDICPNCKARGLSFFEGDQSSEHKYNRWECKECNCVWEHNKPGKNYGYNRYIRRENGSYRWWF